MLFDPGMKMRLNMELEKKIGFEFKIEESEEKIFRVTIGDVLVHERQPDDFQGIRPQKHRYQN